MEVKIASAQGLADCKKLLMLAKAGKYNGYLLEGMGCPGGCIGGAEMCIRDSSTTAIRVRPSRVALALMQTPAPLVVPVLSPVMPLYRRRSLLVFTS